MTQQNSDKTPEQKRDDVIDTAIKKAEKDYPCEHIAQDVIMGGCLSCELVNREGLWAVAKFDLEQEHSIRLGLEGEVERLEIIANMASKLSIEQGEEIKAYQSDLKNEMMAVEALQRKLNECEVGDSYSGNPSKWPHKSQIEGLGLQLADQQKRVEELEKQLPDTMKHCTITFIECPAGHGRLTADNWTKSDCHFCRIDKAESKLASRDSTIKELRLALERITQQTSQSLIHRWDRAEVIAKEALNLSKPLEDGK